MNNTEKENIIIQYSNLIHSIQRRYKIQFFTYEELHQELLTHLCKKLDSYDPTKSELSTYITMCIKGKLNNMYMNRRNVHEEPIGFKIKYILNDEYNHNEKEALAVANEILEKHKHKELLNELIKGKTQMQVAKEFGYSNNWVSLLWLKFINQIRSELSA